MPAVTAGQIYGINTRMPGGATYGLFAYNTYNHAAVDVF
jgi:hypothetical protein